MTHSRRRFHGVCCCAVLATIVLVAAFSSSAEHRTDEHRRRTTAAEERFAHQDGLVGDDQDGDGLCPDSSDRVAGWQPIDVGDPRSEPRPLLELALQRIAAAMSETRNVAARYRVGPALRVDAAWASWPGSPTSACRWYRWTVAACFFRPRDDFGRCYTLDVRARADWAAPSPSPPTEWPVELGTLEGGGGQDPMLQPGVRAPTADILKAGGPWR